MKLFVVVTGLVAAMVTLAAPAHAQKTPLHPATGAGPERRIVIDMDADVIEGALPGPEQLLVHRKIDKKFASLIKLRTDFRKEVLASGAQL